MIPLLRPLFTGEWTALGEALVCAAEPPPDALHVARLVDDAALLDEVLRRHARHLGVDGRDLRAVASNWSLAWLDVLLPPAVAAASVLQHVFPTQADALWVRLDEAGRPLSFHIRDEGRPCPGAGTAQRYAALIDAHLAPLFSQLACHARLAPKILWGNLARRLDGLFDLALQLTGGAPHVAQDRDRLLHAPEGPDGRTNPMCQPQRRVIRLHPQPPLTLHRQCCLCYLLPGQDYCGACPLAPQFQRLRAPAASS